MKSPVLLVVLALALVGGGLVLYLERTSKQPPPPGPAITAEAKAYVRNLKLSDVDMKATKSFSDNMVVEITGNITNNGDRPISVVEVNCIFYDPYQNAVMRERVAIVRARDGGIRPGETKPFRMPFDTLPQNWNQALPQLVIANIQFS